MAGEIWSGGTNVRVVRLFGHRDDAGAWQIRDFLKRSVVEFQWIEVSSEEDYRRELGLSDPKNIDLPVVDESGAMIGVLAVDDVLASMLPADWRRRRCS